MSSNVELRGEFGDNAASWQMTLVTIAGMLGEDLSGRFDYLFSRWKSISRPVRATTWLPERSNSPTTTAGGRIQLVLTGVVLATVAFGVATAIVLLQPAQPAQLIVTPSDATPPTTTAQPVPVVPATVSTSAVQTSAATPTGEPQRPPVRPQSPPVQEPTTVASEPHAPMPAPPTTRAPISVSPESRAPFPNQTPPGSNDQNGGLLGGLL